jgi:hypothetical protein
MVFQHSFAVIAAKEMVQYRVVSPMSDKITYL